MLYTDKIKESPHTELMDFGQRVERGMAARGFKTNRDFADAAKISPQYVTNILRAGAVPALDVLQRIAAALRIDTGDLLSDSEERFLAAFEAHDPSAADSEPAEGRVTDEHRTALVRSLPVETSLRAGGLVDGSLANDVISKRSGRLGEPMKKRLDRRTKAPEVELEGLPMECVLVRAEADVAIRDQEPELVIPRGYLLVVDRERKPASGQLAIGARNANQRETEEPPEMKLLRYHQVGRGWSLAEVDGSDRTYGSGDGWEVVASVLWWRSPP